MAQCGSKQKSKVKRKGAKGTERTQRKQRQGSAMNHFMNAEGPLPKSAVVLKMAFLAWAFLCVLVFAVLCAFALNI
jgi:hypothetical protein